MIEQGPGLGKGVRLQRSTLDLSFTEAFKSVRIPDAYERLLLEAMQGQPDPVHPPRRGPSRPWTWIDSIQEAWRELPRAAESLPRRKLGAGRLDGPALARWPGVVGVAAPGAAPKGGRACGTKSWRSPSGSSAAAARIAPGTCGTWTRPWRPARPGTAPRQQPGARNGGLPRNGRGADAGRAFPPHRDPHLLQRYGLGHHTFER